MSETVLQVEHVTMQFGGVVAVNDLSLEVNKGEIVALIGANGAGKSTILKTVSGLMHPRSGSIHFCDQDITHMEAYKLLRTGLAHVPEGRRIFQQMTVQENLEMGAYIKKDVSQKDLETVFTYFPRLKERRKQLAGTLSGGEQQRVAIARALALHPDILCFDEPTSALDPELTGEVLNVIRSLKTSDSTMIVVTHEIEFARDVADKIIFMADGVIAEEGTPEQVINNPQNPRTQAFLSRFN